MVLESARKGKRVNFPPAVRREKLNALKQIYNDSFFKKNGWCRFGLKIRVKKQRVKNKP